MYFLGEQQNFQLQLTHQLLYKYKVTFSCLFFLLEMACRGLYVASRMSSYSCVPSSSHMDVHIVVLSKGPLAVTAHLCRGRTRCQSLLGRNLCSQVASFRPVLFIKLVWSSDAEEQECAENGSSRGWNPGHELAGLLPSLLLGEAVPWQWHVFCFASFSDGQLWATCHPSST